MESKQKWIYEGKEYYLTRDGYLAMIVDESFKQYPWGTFDDEDIKLNTKNKNNERN